MGSWALWNDRNTLKTGGRCPDVVEKCNWVEEYLEAFLKAREISVSRRPATTSGSSPHRWVRPPAGWVKINSDVACSAGSHRTGIGVVIRDESGQIRAAMTNVQQALYSPFNGEALAILKGLQLARRLNYEFVEVESDCQLLVSMLNGSDSTLSEEGIWIQDIRDLVVLFTEVKFLHVSRKFNLPAHRLAGEGVLMGSFLWLSAFPSWLISAVQADVEVVSLNPNGVF